MLLAVALAAAPALPPAAPRAQENEERVVVHSVCDISQEFSFYMDGRFHRQYLEGQGRDARNWGSLHRLDLSNVNLLVLTGGDARLPYTRRSVQHVLSYVRDGGTCLLMVDGADPMPPGIEVAARFRAGLTLEPVVTPLASVDERVPAYVEIEFRSGTVLELDRRWTPLVVDAEGRPVLGHRELGDGHVLVGSRGLFGRRPDASDPINAAWVHPLLVGLASEKPIDPSLPHRPTRAEHSRELGPLTLEFTDGTEPFAEGVHEVYVEVRPHLVEVTGVEPSPGMLKNLLVLPTGGGGFSSGQRIAIGAWWGGFPERRYKMVELVSHEAGHSWVLPHAEPLWNEPIATYLGIRVGQRLGMPEATSTLHSAIANARRIDPDLTQIDPTSEDAVRNLVWGKAYFVFEELERLHGPDVLVEYFRTKRATLAADREAYTLDDCVAIWSRAVDEDLFEWFRGYAFDVDAERTDLWPR